MKTLLSVQEKRKRNAMLGDLLRALRNERGGMQRDYALKLGFDKPTHLCTVEKGLNSIPQAKINEYAKIYLPEEKEKFAAAIAYFLLPEVWEAITSAFPELLVDKMAKDIESWLDNKFKYYGIKPV